MVTSGHGWDTRGLKFTLKLVLLFVLMLSSAYFLPFAVFGLAVSNNADRVKYTADERLAQLSESRRFKLVLDASRLLELAAQNQIRESSIIADRNIASTVPSEGKFVAFDLDSMKVYTYKDGVVQTSLDILSKGRPGSHWETPAGLYEILLKEPEHFSSIGEVYMPHSMQFYGNYFIHGWPYYADGTAVPEGYSGGCIRLSSEDAQKIYAFSDKGTNIFVYDRPQEGDDTARAPVKVRNINIPRLSAKSYLVADINSGTVFIEEDSSKAMPIASITKLMTALVANETISFGRVIVVDDPSSQQEGDYGSVKKGEKFVVGDALNPLLMESNNVVAYSLAAHYGKNGFIKWMNKKAKALGMDATSFKDASGLSSQNVSTARDLYLLAEYLQKHKSFVLNISKERRKRVESESGRSYEFKNFNHFSGDDNFLGGKTGFTDAARETMLSVFEVPHERSTSTVAIVVLGSEDREGDTKSLLHWFKSAAVEEVADD